MSRGKAEPVSRGTVDPTAAVEVLGRVNRLRGDYLRRTGKEIAWADIGAKLELLPSTITAIKRGDRPLKPAEILRLARLMGGSAGWLMFGEGVMSWTPDTPGVETEEDDDPRSPVVEHPLPKQRRSVTTPAQRPAKRAGGKGGR